MASPGRSWQYAFCVVFCCLHLSIATPRGLPYKDSFANGSADEWHAFGGTWELADGAIRNDSDERGAKLLTGSTQVGELLARSGRQVAWARWRCRSSHSLFGRRGGCGLL